MLLIHGFTCMTYRCLLHLLLLHSTSSSLAGLSCSCPSPVYHTFSLFPFLSFSVSSSVSLSCLTTTVYSNTSGCSEPMGMKSRLVSNRQITASSTFRTWGIEAFTWHPHYARLDKQGKTNAWTAATNNRSEWLQVGQKGITGQDIVAFFVFPLLCLLSEAVSVSLGGPGVSQEDHRNCHTGGQRLRLCPVCDSLQSGSQWWRTVLDHCERWDHKDRQGQSSCA